MGENRCSTKNQITNFVISSYNANNFNSNRVCITDLLKKSHVLCLQEHWLFDFESDILDSFSTDHNVFSKSVDREDPISPIQRPRGYGGVAIFWRKDLNNIIKSLDDGDHRITAITVNTKDEKICIINVYMPCRGYTNSAQEYEDVLAQVAEIMEKFWDHKIIFCGDMNACPFDSPISKYDAQDIILQQFCRDNSLTIPDNYYSGPSFIHGGGRGESAIDHFLVTSTFCPKIEVVYLDQHPTNTSDHIPVTATFTCSINLKKDRNGKPASIPRPNWKKADLVKYKNSIKEQIDHADLSGAVKVMPTEYVIDDLLAIIEYAANVHVPIKKTGTKRNRPWSTDIAHAIKKSKSAYAKLKEAGHPTDVNHPAVIFNKECKKELRRTQRQEAAKQREKEYSDLMQADEDDSQLFYRLIRRQRKTVSN